MAFSSAEKHLRVLRGAGKKVKPEKGQLETEHSNSKREANYKQMKNIRERIKAALNIWRDAENRGAKPEGRNETLRAVIVKVRIVRRRHVVRVSLTLFPKQA